MRSRFVFCLLLLSPFQSFGQIGTDPPTAPNAAGRLATVAGTVFRLDTGEPLKKATVMLANHTHSEGYYEDATDDQGHFRFENIEPGSYYLTVSRNGYVNAEYGQKKAGGPGAVLTLAAGQQMTDLLFKLIRTAAITGRVFDEDGEPLAGAQVSAFRTSRQDGKLRWLGQQPCSTNDLGEFRVYDLAPGRYYVSASYRSAESGISRSGLNTKHKSLDGYLPTYYPNATDPAKAQTIWVHAGDEIRSIDFLLRRTRLATVAGRVIAPVWSSAEPRYVSIFPRETGPMPPQNMEAPYDKKDGTFQIRGVPPGSYYIMASFRERDSSNWLHARREIDVGNVDIEDLTLSVLPGVDILGRLTWEGVPPHEVEDVFAYLEPVEGSEGPGDGQMVKADGTFLLKGVPEGVYRPLVHVRTRNASCFLKSVHYGGVAILDGGLTVHSGSGAFLELVMSSRVAQVNGQVLTGDLLPAVAVEVVLIPDPPRRAEKEKYVFATTDQNGKFSMPGVVPGDYKAFSWDPGASSDEEYREDWFDAAWLSPYEPKGVSVHLEESEHKSADLTLIQPASDNATVP